MHVRVVTPPSFEPVTLAEAKLWLRVDDDDTDQDAMVQLLIIAMRERAEHLTGRAFVTRELELRLDAFPDGEIQLPYAAPLRSVSSIRYLDADGVLQSLDASPTWWQEDAVRIPGVVAPASSQSWPNTGDYLSAVRIAYTVGLVSPSLIPRSVRLWMQAAISTYYEQREQLVINGTVQQLPKTFVDGLLDSSRISYFA